MKLPTATEWVLHCATTLAQLEPGTGASSDRLASYYDLPGPYLTKQLQALARAGVLAASTGPRGGYRLARPAAEITVLEVVEAVDGTAAPYECREIRQQGRGGLDADQCREPCALAVIMGEAHEAWRRRLAATTLADVVDALPDTAPDRTRRLL